MSYILDALKKLEQKRQQEGTITLLASQGQPAKKSKRGRLWVYLILAVLVLNAGIIAWWTAPWKPAAKTGPEKTRTVAQVKASPSPVKGGEIKMETEYVGAKPPAPITDAKEPGSAAAARGTPEPSEKAAAAPEQAIPAAVKPKIPQSPPASQKAAAPQKPPPMEQTYAEPQARPEPKPPRDGRVQRIGDLPASISSTLPEFKMSLHYYIPDPKARFARINDRTLRQGESLADGLKVDEITPAGVIMNCRGWRFLLAISNEK